VSGRPNRAPRAAPRTCDDARAGAGTRTPNLPITSRIAGVRGRPCMFGARRLTCGNVLTVSAGVRGRPDLLLAKC